MWTLVHISFCHNKSVSRYVQPDTLFACFLPESTKVANPLESTQFLKIILYLLPSGLSYSIFASLSNL